MGKTVKLHQKKLVPIHKYKIEQLRIEELPSSVSKLAILEKLLLEEHGITQNEFYRDRNCLQTDEFSIPGDRLAVYAQLFGTTIEDLMNQPIKAKPLIESRIKTRLK